MHICCRYARTQKSTDARRALSQHVFSNLLVQRDSVKSSEYTTNHDKNEYFHTSETHTNTLAHTQVAKSKEKPVPERMSASSNCSPRINPICVFLFVLFQSHMIL